jgi:hypothetical protein
MVGQEAAKKTVINVLTEAGTDVRVPESAGALRDGAPLRLPPAAA